MTQDQNQKPGYKLKYAFVWAGRIVMLLLLIMILLYGILQLPIFQNYIKNKITTYISEKTQTNFTAEELSFGIFEGIALHNFTIVDDSQDTLLRGGAINISLNKNLLYIINNELDLSYIKLVDIKLNIKTNHGQVQSNLQKFIQNLSSSGPPNPNKKPLGLNIKDVFLENISISIIDLPKSKLQNIYLRNGVLDINYMDWICNEFDINSILLDGGRYESISGDKSKIDSILVTENIEVPTKQTKIDSFSEPILLTIRRFEVNDGFFGLKSSQLVSKDTHAIDYKNFHFASIKLALENIRIHEKEGINVNIKSLSATDNTGFPIQNLKADSLVFNDRKFEIPNYTLQFGSSELKHKLTLQYYGYKAFKDLLRNVTLNANFLDSRIVLSDLAHFIPGFTSSAFYKNNKDEAILLNGRYFGTINNISGRDVNIQLGDKLSVAGVFSTRDLLDPNNTVLNIRLDKLQTSMRRFKMIFPGFNPPENYYKLGSINFAGRFDGYLEDFVAYGKIQSDIGTVRLDMRLDLTNGTSKANYSGELSLTNFNLQKWTDNKDFGLVNFNSKVKNGKGLVINTLDVELQATVNSLSFKKYIYKNFTLNGAVNRNTFNGSFKINDPNIDFIFDGSFEYLEKKAFLNFVSQVKIIDLYALHLSSSPLAFKGDMEINTEGNNINDFTGDIIVNNLQVNAKDTVYNLQKVSVSSKELAIGGKELSIKSDLGSINVMGEYDIPNIVKSVKKVIYANYPQVAKTWKSNDLILNRNQKFDFTINLEQSKNFLSLLGVNDVNFKKLSLKGKLNTYINELSIASTIPSLHYKKDSLLNIQLLVSSQNKSGDIYVHVDSTYAFGRKFNPIDIQTRVVGDTINFAFTTERLLDSLENFDIKGQLLPNPKGYQLTLADNLLMMLGSKWNINPVNKIVFGDKYIQFDNMSLSDGFRSLEINDINENKGIELDIVNFDLHLLNGLLRYDKMQFGGLTSLSAKVQNVYDSIFDVTGYMNIPEFFINDTRYGSVYVDISKSKFSPYVANIDIGDFIAINGTYDEKTKAINSKVKLRKAPMQLIEYLLKDGISNTTGNIDADITLNGVGNDLILNGNGIVNDGKVRIVYTGATYYFDKQKVKLTNTEINLDGAIIRDENGNIGTIRGGLYHNLFRKFGVNATLSGNNVIGLNTTKLDNKDYYGYGIGKLSATFEGSFDRINMSISAVTGPGTKLFIPVDNSKGSLDKSFINFVSKTDKQNGKLTTFSSENGINIEMDLTITPDAELSLIFNEAKGDILRGRGRGNLKIDITRKGEFNIFGDYEVEQGEYLFTVNILPVAKLFVVDRGGTIRWTGDPINTMLNISANYRTRTPIKPFIDEYLTLATPETQRLADQRSEVDLKLKMGGTLFKPEITFDLSFPNLTGDISSFAENKLRVLRTNEFELNSQALGLLVFNTFLPSNRVADLFGASGLQSAGINTLSEFISSQLSAILTNLINSTLEEDGLISGVDFEVGVRNNNLGIGNAASANIFPDEIEVRLKNRFRFMDERLSLNVGGNYVFQNQGLAVNQVLPDFALELELTDDRKVKVRLYGKGDLDPINNTSLRQKYGFGVGYRTEFGNMVDFPDSALILLDTTIKK